MHSSPLYSALQLADQLILPPLYFSASGKSLALFLCCLVTLIRFYFQEKCCLHIVQTYLRNRKILHFLTVQYSLLLNWLFNYHPSFLLFYTIPHSSLYLAVDFFQIMYHLCFSWPFTSYIMYFIFLYTGSFSDFPYIKFISWFIFHVPGLHEDELFLLILSFLIRLEEFLKI